MVPGAQHHPKFKAKIWDGKIRLFDVRKRQILRGLSSKIIEFCEDRDYDFTYDDESRNNFSLNEAQDFIKSLNLKHTPRDYQVEAFVDAIRNKRMLLLSPTASGKSLIAYLIVRYLIQTQTKGLVIVPTVALVEQLFTDFQDYSELNKWDVDLNTHRIYSGKEKFCDKKITISTWQSIATLSPTYLEQFDFIVGDEAHKFSAKLLKDIMSGMINAEYRIGMTGSLDGTKTHRLVLEGLFGKISKNTTTKQLIEEDHLADLSIKCLLLKHDAAECSLASKFSYQEEISYLISNSARNDFIKNLALSLKGNTLVLFQFVENHGEVLYDLISKSERSLFFISGKTPVEDRELVRKIVETENNAIIVASYGTFSTGTNIKNLHNVIFASPSKSRIRNLQSIGRVLRKSETKTSSTLYDIADDLRVKKKENYTLKHFTERIRLYAEEGFPYKIYKIDLKTRRDNQK